MYVDRGGVHTSDDGESLNRIVRHEADRESAHSFC